MIFVTEGTSVPAVFLAVVDYSISSDSLSTLITPQYFDYFCLSYADPQQGLIMLYTFNTPNNQQLVALR